jgi:hypothetical protein
MEQVYAFFEPHPLPVMAQRTLLDRLRAFWDFLVLFSGISTASNLARTRRHAILTRGIFLFRAPDRN